jgi:hypothetical protein
MKKVLCAVLLTVLGCLPLPVGRALNDAMMNDLTANHHLWLPGFGLLAVWVLLGLAGRALSGSTKLTLLSLNAVPFAVLVLIGVQELIRHAYWFNAVGTNTQMFYLPLIKISFDLARWSHTMFPVYCTAFCLLVLAAFLGCKAQQLAQKRRCA